MSVSLPYGGILDKIAVVEPVKKVARPGPVDKKRTIRGSKRKLISPRAKPSEKQRSVLGEPKYVPVYKPHWKAGSACYPAFYKALLDEHLRANRINMVRACGVSSSTRNQ